MNQSRISSGRSFSQGRPGFRSSSSGHHESMSRPASSATSPSSATRPHIPGAMATATSCPARCSARASGSIGWRWPAAGVVETSTRMRSLLYHSQCRAFDECAPKNRMSHFDAFSEAR